ncbi:hypothetical protein GA0061094_2675 [[Bacillus] enclensis]|uniref:Uncharacterized protein n=1 Tax=[Bacillus] enclensis TaxID=1402860 RepID=A0A1C4C672_9BACI|nr:hypothetical protein GA0061094_2675 [[Bacillus] enclensis]
MKKLLGLIITFVWVTMFFYFFNMLVPRGFMYVLISLPVVFISSFFILKISGFKL